MIKLRKKIKKLTGKKKLSQHDSLSKQDLKLNHMKITLIWFN